MSAGAERSLCRRLLDERWSRLDPRLQRFFDRAGAWHGQFEVRANRLLARLVGLTLGLPRAARSVPMRLVVVPDGPEGAGGERWVRHFGETRLESDQRASDGLLVERVGILELRFRLLPNDAREIVFELDGAALNLGACRLGLPRWLAPRIDASMSVDGGLKVQVAMAAPFIGRLLAYSGRVDEGPDEEATT